MANEKKIIQGGRRKKANVRGLANKWILISRFSFPKLHIFIVGNLPHSRRRRKVESSAHMHDDEGINVMGSHCEKFYFVALKCKCNRAS